MFSSRWARSSRLLLSAFLRLSRKVFVLLRIRSSSRATSRSVMRYGWPVTCAFPLETRSSNMAKLKASRPILVRMAGILAPGNRVGPSAMRFCRCLLSWVHKGHHSAVTDGTDSIIGIDPVYRSNRMCSYTFLWTYFSFHSLTSRKFLLLRAGLSTTMFQHPEFVSRHLRRQFHKQ